MDEVTAADETAAAAACPPAAPHQAFRLAVRMQRGQVTAESVASASDLNSATLALIPEALELAFHLSYLRLLVEARIEALEASTPGPQIDPQPANRTGAAASRSGPPPTGVPPGACLLDLLPTDVQFTVMSHAGLHSCSRLGLCSHHWSALVLRWLGMRADEEMPRKGRKPGHLLRWGGWGVLGYDAVQIPEGESGYASVATAAYAREGIPLPWDALGGVAPPRQASDTLASSPPPAPSPPSLSPPPWPSPPLQSSPQVLPAQPSEPPPVLTRAANPAAASPAADASRPAAAAAAAAAGPLPPNSTVAAPSPPSSAPPSSASSRCTSPRPPPLPAPPSPPPPAASAGALFDLLITQTTDFLGRGGKAPSRALLRAPRNELLRRATVQTLLRALVAAVAHGPSPEEVLSTLDRISRQLRLSKPHSTLPAGGVGWVLRSAQAHRQWTAHDLVRAHLLTHYREGPLGASSLPDATLIPFAPPRWSDAPPPPWPAPTPLTPGATHPPTATPTAATLTPGATPADAAPPVPSAWRHLALENFLIEELRNATSRVGASTPHAAAAPPPGITGAAVTPVAAPAPLGGIPPARQPLPSFSPAAAAAAALCRMGSSRRGCPAPRTRALLMQSRDTAGGGDAGGDVTAGGGGASAAGALEGAAPPPPNTAGGGSVWEREGNPDGEEAWNTGEEEEEPDGDLLWASALGGLNLDPSGCAWALVCSSRLSAEQRCRDAWGETTRDLAREAARALHACLRGRAEAERPAPPDAPAEGEDRTRVRLFLTVFFGRVSAAARVQAAPRASPSNYVTRLEEVERLHTYPTPLLADLQPNTRAPDCATNTPTQGSISGLASLRCLQAGYGYGLCSENRPVLGHHSPPSDRAAECDAGSASSSAQSTSGAGPSDSGARQPISGPTRSISGAAASGPGNTTGRVPDTPCLPWAPLHALALLRSYFEQAPFASAAAAAHFVFALCSERFGPPGAPQLHLLGRRVTPAALGAVAAAIGMTEPQVSALRSIACSRRAHTLSADAGDETGDPSRSFLAAWASGVTHARSG